MPLAATCLSAAAGSFLMGGFAKYPIALAPGMGLNEYFTYAVVKGMGVPWQVALGAVFVSGAAFLILTVAGIRQLIVSAIPFELHSAVAAGVGLFIAFIGLKNADVIVADRATTVTLGTCGSPPLCWRSSGCSSSRRYWRRTRAAMLIGIVATGALGLGRESRSGSLRRTECAIWVRRRGSWTSRAP
jgi:AGZA family xanthine/uracil permease-like MFS transporter